MKRGWRVIGGIGLAVGLWLATPAAARRMDFFRVRRIELVGARHLPPDAMLAALALRPNANIFDDLTHLTERLSSMPGVTVAAVGRRIPGTLTIAVDEAVPVALTPGARGMRIIDARGTVLPFDPARSAPDLPIAASADSLVATLLGRALAFEPALFAQIERAWRVRDDVIVEVGGRRLWFRPDASAEEMRAIVAVLGDLTRRRWTFEELDGRFAGQVIVRRSRA